MKAKLLIVGLLTLLSGCVYEEYINLELQEFAEVSYFVDKTRLVINTNLIYENDRSTLRPQAVKILRSLYRQVSKEFFTDIKVIAHSDDAITAKTAQEVTYFQAQSIAGYFWFRGVDAAELSYEGRGYSEPVAEMATPSGVYANQRIEIILT